MKKTSAEHRRSTYFISDLHLDPSHPLLFSLFNDFIDNIKKDAEALYILGDLFEFWIGDDVIGHPLGEPYQPVLDKLKSLSDSGTQLYFLQGNRDFLAQTVFCKAIGATLLPDQYLIELYGKTALLMHGDTLCTDDVAYQRMRFIFRLKLVQKLYLFLSPANRVKKANKARSLSERTKEKKDVSIMDVNQSAVENVIQNTLKSIKTRGGVLLIHGHTHRPAIHTFDVDNHKVKRIVLGDWHDKACYLKINEEAFEFVY